MIEPPLSLYVHLPWCVRKCPYCDFNSHTAGNTPPKQQYIDALLIDIEQESARAKGRAIESVFLGGGTPSLFTPEEIARLLTGVSSYFDLADDAEVTMEANPGTVECGAPAGYRDAGVTRLSIGAQSFDDEMLKMLGRIHSSADIMGAMAQARAAGYENLNVDIMHGLPGQTIEMAMSDLESAVALEPAHISWYQLTLEPNTVFYARPPAGLPNDELSFEIQDCGTSLLKKNGYKQYEVSAYARDGRQCRHNLNYWLFGDYLAVGAGAHGKLSVGNSIGRYKKPAHPLTYMNSTRADSAAMPLTWLGLDDIVFEFMLNGTRLRRGFPEKTFCEHTGLTAGDLDEATLVARERGLLVRTPDAIWCATGLGRRFLNDLQALFLPETA